MEKSAAPAAGARTMPMNCQQLQLECDSIRLLQLFVEGGRRRRLGDFVRSCIIKRQCTSWARPCELHGDRGGAFLCRHRLVIR